VKPLLNHLRKAAKRVAYCGSDSWGAASRLFLMWDTDAWSISWDMRELRSIAERLGIQVADPRWRGFCRNQAMFHGTQFALLSDEWFELPHRMGLAYFHGRPGSGVPEFDVLYKRLRQHHHRIDRVQVSHSEMRDIVLESGIDASKVFQIPIGVNPSFFVPRTPELRRAARERHGIPQSAVTIGSFQKDGEGWGDGMEPKRIKGPDIFLDVVAGLRAQVPELYVVLTGPARGYVQAGLERLGIPYRHLYLNHYPDIGTVYQVLDLYLITSRQEGGPKAVLESMASGVPLVTTRVGQAMDLVRHGENGFMAEVEDVDALTEGSLRALSGGAEIDGWVAVGMQTVRDNTYESQLPLWTAFMDGFVEMSPTAGGGRV